VYYCLTQNEHFFLVIQKTGDELKCSVRLYSRTWTSSTTF